MAGVMLRFAHTPVYLFELTCFNVHVASYKDVSYRPATHKTVFPDNYQPYVIT